MVVRGLALGIAMTQLAAPPLANAALDGSSRPPPTGAEFARLEAQVNEQRQLIIQLMQSEQQRYDMLLKLLGNPAAASTTAVPATAATAATESASAAAAGSGKGAGAAATPAIPQRKLAAIDGKVSISGGDLSDIYKSLGSRVATKKEKREITAAFAAVGGILLAGAAAAGLRTTARLP